MLRLWGVRELSESCLPMVDIDTLVAYSDSVLCAQDFADYAPNGLQVEGDRPISRVVSGVTASASLIDAAISLEADALLVHHGWFWKSEPPCLVGMKGRRARALLSAGISLIAYHLPLDAHVDLGNNAMLARHLDILNAVPTDLGGGVVWRGLLPEDADADGFAGHLDRVLGRPPIVVGKLDRPIRTLAWCTGGGQGYIEQAAALGVDAFVSGELSEQTTHQARELGIVYFAAGHHATERFGIQALGEHLAKNLGVWHRFVDIANPA